jgi:hypothetical protein
MKMEQTRQKIREMMAVDAHYAQVELLWTRLWAEMKQNVIARQEKLDASSFCSSCGTNFAAILMVSSSDKIR